MSNLSQNETIKRHLQQGRSITSLMAFTKYGCTRLASRIYDLRDAGLKIKDRWITVLNRFGKRCDVKEYYL